MLPLKTRHITVRFIFHFSKIRRKQLRRVHLFPVYILTLKWILHKHTTQFFRLCLLNYSLQTFDFWFYPWSILLTYCLILLQIFENFFIIAMKLIYIKLIAVNILSKYFTLIPFDNLRIIVPILYFHELNIHDHIFHVFHCFLQIVLLLLFYCFFDMDV